MNFIGEPYNYEQFKKVVDKHLEGLVSIQYKYIQSNFITYICPHIAVELYYEGSRHNHVSKEIFNEWLIKNCKVTKEAQ